MRHMALMSYVVWSISIISFTEMEMSLFWWDFHHWMLWKVMFWQLCMLAMMKMSATQQYFRFSVFVYLGLLILISVVSKSFCFSFILLWRFPCIFYTIYFYHFIFPFSIISRSDHNHMDQIKWILLDLIWIIFAYYYWYHSWHIFFLNFFYQS